MILTTSILKDIQVVATQLSTTITVRDTMVGTIHTTSISMGISTIHITPLTEDGLYTTTLMPMDTMGIRTTEEA